MSLGDTHFDALYASQPDAQGTITTKNGDVIACICAGLSVDRFDTDNGIINTISGVIRTKFSLLPETGCDNKDVVTFTDAQAIAQVVRITGRKNTSGMCSFMVEAVNA